MRNRFIYLILIIFSVFACKNEPLKVDVSSVDYEIEILRIEQGFKTATNLDKITMVNSELAEKGKDLYAYYTSEMLHVGQPKQDSTPVFIQRFLEDSIMKIINQRIDTKFSDFSSSNIVDMFKHLKYHIPNAILPAQIVTYNSTFTNGILSTSDMIGVGLEMYLGETDDIIQQVPFPEYFKRKMNADFMLADMAESWLSANVIENQSSESFISNLIYYGKLLYLVKAMLPEMKNHLVLRYSKAEYEWAEASEFNVWQYIVEQNWVYSEEMKLRIRYFKPAPTTVGIEGSPSKLGQYLGWKIINDYMAKYPDVTVKDLIKEKNITKILKAYKPKEL